MKGTRSFRKSRKLNRSRRGGKQPRGLGSRRSAMRSSIIHHYMASHGEGPPSLLNWLIFIFIALAISANVNQIDKPWKPFSPSVHFADNPLTHSGLIRVPKSLPTPSALQNINLMKSPSFTRVSDHSIGSTPLQFAQAMGIPSKYTSRSDFLPSDMYWRESLRQLDLGPRSTIRNLIEKIVEEAEGDKKAEIKKALLEADKLANEPDILSRSRSSDEMQQIREEKSASKGR